MRRWFGFKIAADFKSIHSRHVHVEEDQAWPQRCRLENPLLAVEGRVNVNSLPVEMESHEFVNLGRIVNNQHRTVNLTSPRAGSIALLSSYPSTRRISSISELICSRIDSRLSAALMASSTPAASSVMESKPYPPPVPRS